MGHASTNDNILPGSYVASTRTKTIYTVCMFLGVLTFAWGLMSNQERTWHSFLVSFFFFLCLGLGGLFFTAIQHVTNAGWSVNVRRFAEAMASYIPWAALTAVVFYFGRNHLYEWLDTEIVSQDPILAGKSGYLNLTFFTIRLVLFFALWICFGRLMVGRSVEQDKSGDEMLTVRNVPTAIAFLAVFALSFSFFSVDALMSLQPHWFSTIFGVYCFAGLFQSTIAVLVLLTIYMMRKGLVRGLVSDHHLHDLGKFLKAFTVFYAYIGFSQFMLIWYANQPEETIFYLNRAGGMWMAVSYSLLIFKFIVPFLLLLPKAAKRNPAHLTFVSILILVMQYVDVHWLVYPNLDQSHWLLGWQEIGVFLGFLGLFICAVSGFLSKNAIVPVKDPRRHESIHHHVTY